MVHRHALLGFLKIINKQRVLPLKTNPAKLSQLSINNIPRLIPPQIQPGTRLHLRSARQIPNQRPNPNRLLSGLAPCPALIKNLPHKAKVQTYVPKHQLLQE
jgi:hypothetical protein